jgi:uncharacterized protein (DUF488 family)
VRSVPYSRYASQFNKSNIQKVLPANGIKYLFLGKELGGRPQDPRFYDSEGNVLYSKIAESPCFTEGIERLTRSIRKYQVAIMCSEENPDHCHRRLLIGEILTGKAIQVLHIRKNGTIQSGDDIIRENKKC